MYQDSSASATGLGHRADSKSTEPVTSSEKPRDQFPQCCERRFPRPRTPTSVTRAIPRQPHPEGTSARYLRSRSVEPAMLGKPLWFTYVPFIPFHLKIRIASSSPVLITYPRAGGLLAEELSCTAGWGDFRANKRAVHDVTGLARHGAIRCHHTVTAFPSLHAVPTLLGRHPLLAPDATPPRTVVLKGTPAARVFRCEVESS